MKLSKYDIDNTECTRFSNSFSEILDKSALKRRKDISANQSSFMNKTITKAVLKELQLHVKSRNLKKHIKLRET